MIVLRSLYQRCQSATGMTGDVEGGAADRDGGLMEAEGEEDNAGANEGGGDDDNDDDGDDDDGDGDVLTVQHVGLHAVRHDAHGKVAARLRRRLRLVYLECPAAASSLPPRNDCHTSSGWSRARSHGSCLAFFCRTVCSCCSLL